MTRDDIIELALQCGIWIPIARGRMVKADPSQAKIAPL